MYVYIYIYVYIYMYIYIYIVSILYIQHVPPGAFCPAAPPVLLGLGTPVPQATLEAVGRQQLVHPWRGAKVSSHGGTGVDRPL